MKYAWIRKHRDSFPIALMCDVLAVSKVGLLRLARPAAEPAGPAARADRAAVRQVHAASHGIYGSDKIAQELAQRDDLEPACRNTVARAMRELGLKSRVSKAFTPTTTQADPTAAGAQHAGPRLHGPGPNRKWVTDITYLPTPAGWVYLAVVLDLFSRKVVGWAMADRWRRRWWPWPCGGRSKPGGRREELLHHSDRGCQYTSDAYQRTLRTLGIECSMSRTGDCYDNAVIERFFWSLKHEWTKHESSTTWKPPG